MIIKKLSLLNYKNFDSRDFEFDSKINCLVGHNGVGKTNTLDAIYHLCFGKSYFNPIASQNIRHGTEFFVLEGLFQLEDREEKIVCSLKKGAGKTIKRNDKIYERIADHIGLLPLVIISPADRDLITEGSDMRRKFMDGVIAQSDKNYLQDLLRYNKILAQRNALLKYFSLNHNFDATTLETYDEQLDHYGSAIFEKRTTFATTLLPIFEDQYQRISGKEEPISLRYQSSLQNGPLRTQLQDVVAKDRALQYTSAGIHRDDLLFEIEGHPIKKFGSQGQQKSFLIALKFAQFHFIKEKAGTSPVLLLDDIFDKLDERRVAQIVELVEQEEFGQIFISDTHAERTENIVKQIHQSYKIFNL